MYKAPLVKIRAGRNRKSCKVNTSKICQKKRRVETQLFYRDMYAPYPLSQQSQLPLMQPFGQNGLSFSTTVPISCPFLPPFSPLAWPIKGSRTIYLGGLLLGSTPKDVLSQIRAGAVENYQVSLDKLCAFVSFVKPSAAKCFITSWCVRVWRSRGWN